MKKVLIILFIIALVLILAGTRKKPQIVGYGYSTCTSLIELTERFCPEYVGNEDFINEVVELNCMDSYSVEANRLYQYPVYVRR